MSPHNRIFEVWAMPLLNALQLRILPLDTALS
jgi:hypothetical protein